MLQRGYTRAVPATQIAQNLAFINWTLLTGLALGPYAAVVLLRRRTSATRGYLRFTALCALGFGMLAWISDGALPASLGDSPVVVDPAWDAPRRAGAAGCSRCSWRVGLVARRRGPAAPAAPRVRRASPPAIAHARVRGPGLGRTGRSGRCSLLVQLAVVSAAIGGVFAAMILGHWYLVTPKLPEAPLILLARVLLAVVASRSCCSGPGSATGAGPADVAPFSSLVGPWALFVWLRLIVGLVFPLVVCWAAVQTARTRSMESATGLLYINVGSIAAGTILAAGLYFGAGPARVRRDAMSKNDRTWIPDAADLDWIESLAAPLAARPRRHRGGRRDRSASRSSTATPGGSCPSWPAAGAGSSRSAPPTATRRSGWRSASRPAARS